MHKVTSEDMFLSAELPRKPGASVLCHLHNISLQCLLPSFLRGISDLLSSRMGKSNPNSVSHNISMGFKAIVSFSLFLLYVAHSQNFEGMGNIHFFKFLKQRQKASPFKKLAVFLSNSFLLKCSYICMEPSVSWGKFRRGNCFGSKMGLLKNKAVVLTRDGQIYSILAYLMRAFKKCFHHYHFMLSMLRSQSGS